MAHVFKGFLTYLQTYQFLPYERTKELIADLFNHTLSMGTLSNTQKYAFEQLDSFEEQLKTLLTLAAVAGFDETGLRVLNNRKMHRLSISLLLYKQL